MVYYALKNTYDKVNIFYTLCYPNSSYSKLQWPWLALVMESEPFTESVHTIPVIPTAENGDIDLDTLFMERWKVLL